MARIEKVSRSEVKQGDTIIIDGKMNTIGKDSVKNTPFVGVAINGKTFRETNRICERVLFPKWFKGEIVGFAAQI